MSLRQMSFVTDYYVNTKRMLSNRIEVKFVENLLLDEQILILNTYLGDSLLLMVLQFLKKSG